MRVSARWLIITLGPGAARDGFGTVDEYHEFSHCVALSHSGSDPVV